MVSKAMYDYNAGAGGWGRGGGGCPHSVGFFGRVLLDGESKFRLFPGAGGWGGLWLQMTGA